MNIGLEYLLDTNVIIRAFLGEEPTASFIATLIKNGKIAISSLTIAEFISKATAIEKEKFNILKSELRIIAVDENIAQSGGEYRAAGIKKTKKVYLVDCLIAATAKIYNLVLVTRNVKDYPMKDLKIIDPAKSIS